MRVDPDEPDLLSWVGITQEGVTMASKRKVFSLTASVIVGFGALVTAQPAEAFFGSFAQSCRDIRVYGGGAYMTAFCRRFDGSYRFSRIYNCGGAGVRNDNGYMRCGT